MRLTFHSQVILSAIFLLSSCTSTGPKYDKPIAMPTQWHTQDKKTKLSPVHVNQLAWWKKFHDPLLNQLIATALTHNNDIAIATGNMVQAKAALQKVRAGWLPTIGLGGAAFTAQFSDFTTQNPGFIPPNLIPNSNFNANGYAAGFVPGYTLNIMRQIKLNEVAHLNIEMRAAAINAVRLGVISQTAGSYFSLLGLKRQLLIQDQMISDAEALRKYTRIQVQDGAVSEEKLAALDQLIATLKKKIPTLQHNIIQVQNALNVIIDKNPEPLITRNNFANIHTKGIIPVNLPSAVLKSRPDVAIADYEVRIKSGLIGVAASQMFPTINLTGMFGSASLAFGSLLRFGNGLGIGEAIAAMPIFDPGILADIEKGKGEKYSTYYNYIKVVRTAFADVENGLSQHSTVNESYEQQAIALKSAKDAYHIGMQQYQQGMIAYSDTIMYKLNVDYMEAMLNDYKMQQLASIVNLYQVLGGGYCAER